MSSGSCAAASVINADIIQIYLADGTFKSVRVDSQTTVKRIVDVVLEGLGIDQLSFAHFALRLNGFDANTSGGHSDDFHWLHPSLRIPQIRRRYLDNIPIGVQLRFELRIRFILYNIHEMYQTEIAAFLYLFEQLSVDYMRHVAWKIDAAKALEMAALAIRKRFPTLTSVNVEKKLDFGLIEREGGLIKYLPEALIINAKRKHLQNSIIAAVRKVIFLTEIECVFRFIKILSDITPFDVEVFCACIGANWQDPVDIHIGHNVGISYYSENSRKLVKLTNLQNITKIAIHRLDLSLSSKTLVKLNVLASPNPLTFTLPTLNLAESFAHLIDGYRMIIFGCSLSDGQSGNTSAWQLEGDEAQLSPLLANCSLIVSPKAKRSNGNDTKKMPLRQKGSLIPNALEKIGKSGEQFHDVNFSVDKKELSNFDRDFVDQCENYIYSMVQELNIETKSIRLEDLLGNGQFGNVYKGLYEYNHAKMLTLTVAVKVCKSENGYCDTSLANKYLLDEAHTMAQFRHPHIIKLIGVCTSSLPTVWIVMELAALGELRGYLQREKSCIDTLTQITFAYQLSSALTHMHNNNFLHRDVAARNCLVANPRCVKLSDFGLSRRLRECEEVYTASQGKLPIKWLPPESINYRKFTALSDVYMFGVCIWEILTFGQKPWQNVRNHDVIERVERGERLRRPEGCPEALYALLMSMWSMEVTRRPTMVEVKQFLNYLWEEIGQHVSFDCLTFPSEYFNVKSQRRSFDDLNNNNVSVVLNENLKNSVNKQKQLVSNRRRSNSASALRLDQERISSLSLRSTLEEQRVQCNEDDKWLEEEELKLLPPGALNSRPSLANGFDTKYENGTFPHKIIKSSPRNENGHHKTSKSNYENHKNKSFNDISTKCRTSMELDRTNDTLHRTVVNLIRLISELSKSYSANVPNKEFLEDVDQIEHEVRLLLDESTLSMLNLSDMDRKQVSLMQTLINSNLRSLNKATKILINEFKDSNLRPCDFHRREVLRMSHFLAVNSKNFLDSFDCARINSGLAKFRPFY